MRRVCAWCARELGEVEGAGAEAGGVTHTICEECADAALALSGVELGAFLDRFAVPIVAVDGEGLVTNANASARKMLGKEQTEIAGRPGGVVFECAYARLPGGCGRTVHCSGCTIRLSVMETHRTGASIRRRPAYLDHISPDGTVRIEMLISTHLANAVAYLAIEKFGDAGPVLPLI